MNESTLSNARTQSLAGLMGMTGEEPTRRSLAEPCAVLAAPTRPPPLEFDLRTIAPGGEKTITDLTAAVTSGLRPRSFGDLVALPLPPLDLLRLMKIFPARAGYRSLPKEVATVLYYTAISLALLRHNVRITELDNRSLVKSIGWCLSQSWVDASVAAVLAEMCGELPAPSAAT